MKNEVKHTAYSSYRCEYPRRGPSCFLYGGPTIKILHNYGAAAVKPFVQGERVQ